MFPHNNFHYCEARENRKRRRRRVRRKDNSVTACHICRFRARRLFSFTDNLDFLGGPLSLFLRNSSANDMSCAGNVCTQIFRTYKSAYCFLLSYTEQNAFTRYACRKWTNARGSLLGASEKSGERAAPCFEARKALLKSSAYRRGQCGCDYDKLFANFFPFLLRAFYFNVLSSI